MELDDHRAKPMTKNMDQTHKIVASNQFVFRTGFEEF